MKTPASRRRRIRSRRSSRRYGLAVALAAAALFAAALMATISGGRGNQTHSLADFLDSPVIFDGFPELISLDSPDAATARPVFRHSVIPGGAYTPAELRNALARDTVASSHYPSLEPDAVRAAVVTQDRLAYVSYRKDDQIYWTRNKVRLSAGETILTDGTHEIRARCGNCISDTPMLPVADVEPDAAELDRLVDESEPNQAGDPFLAAAVRSALGSPGSDQNMLGGPGGSGQPGGVASSSGIGTGPESNNAGPGGGRIGPTAFAGSGPSFGGLPSVGGGQPGAAPPSSPGDAGNSPADPPGLAGPAPGSPTPFGSAPGGPASGGPDGPFGPPGTTPWLPPGINPPPGFDPTPGVNPPGGLNPPPGVNPPAGLNPPPGVNPLSDDPGLPGPQVVPPTAGGDEPGNPVRTSLRAGTRNRVSRRWRGRARSTAKAPTPGPAAPAGVALGSVSATEGLEGDSLRRRKHASACACPRRPASDLRRIEKRSGFQAFLGSPPQ